MNKVLVIPLYMGKQAENRSGEITHDIHVVKKYLKRAIPFFGTREGITVLYPEDKYQICNAHIHNYTVDKILVDPIVIKMDGYVDADNSFYGEDKDEPIKSQLVTELSSERVKDVENLIIFINMNHSSKFIGAYKSVHGPYAEGMHFDFFSIGEIGNTDAFFFNKDDKDSIEYFKFHSHLDFFIPENMEDLSSEIMAMAVKIHRKIRLKGKAKYLKNMASVLN